MPLTPAEVHNVAFKKPPIGKRGYDEEEVDAFLDIVEVELSRLIEENNDLRARGGSAAPAAQAAPAKAADGASEAELVAAREENARMQSHIAELERALTQGKDGVQRQVVEMQQQLAQTEQQLAENRRELAAAQQAVQQAQQAGGSQAAPQAAVADQATQAVQVLVLAQQTADQHLSQSKAEAERLLTEAQTSAEQALRAAQERSSKHVGDAESRANQLDQESTARAAQVIQDAEQRSATITAQFEQRKAALERRVEELRTFEREYRTRLKSYLESQLRDLEASGKAEPANPNAKKNFAGAQQG
jgi:DivIVA domain-containing protein